MIEVGVVQLRIADCGLRISQRGAVKVKRGFRSLDRKSAVTTMLAVWFGIVGLAGCPSSPPPSGAASSNQSQQEALRRADRGAALLKAAVRQLNDLPAAVDTQLQEPRVILDASKSSDNQDVLAVFLRNPNLPEGPVNVVSVPANNARFRGLGVKPGDILKYYVLEDETVDATSREAGFTRRVAMELVVAQVIDDQTLLVETGLNTEVPNPERIEIWRFVDERQREINRQLTDYLTYRQPPLGWEPSPDAKTIDQIVVWLNQWLRQTNPKADWRVEPLLQSLPQELLTGEPQGPYLSNEALGATVFQPHEGRLLQEAVWHRDIARWARGDNYNNVDRATALFDWTVQNVQLSADDAGAPHRPWQVLLYGRGTAAQRAWVFALLCRQLGLEVVMLGIPSAPSEGSDGSTASMTAQFWLAALVDGGQLYLFDTRLGLPIPGPNRQGIATLAQVQADDSLVRQLDLPDSPYPVTADTIESVEAWIVADPFELTRRARLVESQLTGDDGVALTVDASALAEQIKSLPQIAGVELWDLPFRTLRNQLTLENTSRNPARLREVLAFEPFAVRPVLWKARSRHFQGRRQIVGDEKSADTDEAIDDHREAAQLYTDKTVRPTDRAIARTASSDRQRVDTSAKLDATYWVGLLRLADGMYDVSESWLKRPELHAAGSRWVFGARYNLARTHEALGKIDEAIALLQADTSPQQHGNKLRAQWLKSQSEKAAE
jgi:hypothetical protein